MPREQKQLTVEQISLEKPAGVAHEQCVLC